MNFTEWLAKQRNRGTPLGDLAREAAEDDGWPAEGTTLAVFEEHLRRMHASEAAHDTLARAWQSYQRANRRR